MSHRGYREREARRRARAARRALRRARRGIAWRDRVFRSRRDSVFFGVCGGIAEHFDVPPWALRIAVIIVMTSTGIFPVVLTYVILGLLMRKEPKREYEAYEDEEFWNVYQTSRAEALRKVSRAFDHLDERIQRMERVVTSRDFELEEEYRKL